MVSKEVATKTTIETAIVGWQEWCALPELDLPAMKVKIDTGAKTSSLHAVNIEPFQQANEWYARFDVHPIQTNDEICKNCVARLVDQRRVKSSSGHEEHRYVIFTPITLAGDTWGIHITLTNRNAMEIRMLLGREAMKDRIMVNPSAIFCHGRMTRRKVLRAYQSAQSS
ncbi:MAG: RimK/LysX family protein [Gammaproteobacteria bacterium]|nr:RimK/LysX family protein [Pseudomonadota bacterium]MCH9663428.1 RimK/LysX family protein [Gammaproteobacteria bacterium]